MDTGTLKTSTIFISTGKRTKVYHSIEDIPPVLRKRLEASTSGLNSATMLIADRNGREELVRSIQGLPSGVQTRVAASRRNPKIPVPPALYLWRTYRHWIELSGVGLLGLACWLTFLK
jgi:hypothetical protein